ncbi:MAG: hypothetical protein LBB53_06235 [Prevotellaceae bacterium]|jgi:hypothetical protein|nr:hypothetical protein [Prevotellaceae bacterium]
MGAACCINFDISDYISIVGIVVNSILAVWIVRTIQNKLTNKRVLKPVTVKSNFGGYSATERMKASFADFEEKFGGKVFVVFSLDGEIANKEVIEQIRNEIIRLK